MSGVLIPYLRQSRKREKTISIQEQRRSIEAWAKGEGVKLAEPIVEQNVSGSKPWRERGLGSAVKACEDGHAAGITVAWQDRLSRENGLATAEVWEALDRAGARLVATSEGLDTAKGDQEMLFSIKAAIAREQWKRYAKNWDDAKRNAVEKGVHICSHLPLGYDRGDDGRLAPNEHANLVKELFRLRAHGSSWSELCSHIESAGVKPMRGGERWAIHTVSAIIRNPVYRGQARQGKHVNEDAHDPIVTRAEWLAAQIEHPSRRSRGTEGTLLAGIVKCAQCGRRMIPERGGIDKRDGSKRHGRYRCKPRQSTGDPCDHPANVNMKQLDEMVVEQFLQRWDPEVGDVVVEHEQQPDVEPLRRDLDFARDALDSLISDTDSLAVLPPEKRHEMLANAQRRIDDAQAALDEVEVNEVTRFPDIGRLGDHFVPEGVAGEETSLPDRRRLLGLGIESVLVKRGKGDLDKRVTIAFRDVA